MTIEIFVSGESGGAHPISHSGLHGLPRGREQTRHNMPFLQPEMGRVVPGLGHHVLLRHLRRNAVLHRKNQSKFKASEIIN